MKNKNGGLFFTVLECVDRDYKNASTNNSNLIPRRLRKILEAAWQLHLVSSPYLGEKHRFIHFLLNLESWPVFVY